MIRSKVNDEIRRVNNISFNIYSIFCVIAFILFIVSTNFSVFWLINSFLVVLFGFILPFLITDSISKRSSKIISIIFVVILPTALIELFNYVLWKFAVYTEVFYSIYSVTGYLLGIFISLYLIVFYLIKLRVKEHPKAFPNKMSRVVRRFKYKSKRK